LEVLEELGIECRVFHSLVQPISLARSAPGG
jgi:hypothetical protein